MLFNIKVELDSYLSIDIMTEHKSCTGGCWLTSSVGEK
jgi:hypothetical protein